ncbi:hypothetical protein TB2_034771 [Malus domestica]
MNEDMVARLCDPFAILAKAEIKSWNGPSHPNPSGWMRPLAATTKTMVALPTDIATRVHVILGCSYGCKCCHVSRRFPT